MSFCYFLNSINSVNVEIICPPLLFAPIVPKQKEKESARVKEPVLNGVEGSCVLNSTISEQPECGGLDNGEAVNVEQNDDVAEERDSSDDDSVKDVHFNDSEEKRDLGIDDGFNMPEMGEVETTLNEQVQNMKVKYVAVRVGYGSPIKNTKRRSGVNENGNAGGNVATEPVVNEGGSAGGNVATEPVVNEGGSSGVVNEGGSAGGNVGVETVVNEGGSFGGSETANGAGDGVTSGNVEAFAPPDVVGGSETFRVKTLVPRHKCGRTFNNKNANSRWIAKVVVEKFRTSSKVTLSEIVDDIIKNYSAGGSGTPTESNQNAGGSGTHIVEGYVDASRAPDANGGGSTDAAGTTNSG
ncbi:hypothetical protein SESBI_49702 [Sesbania bispinosa]|nr:hypothetical protein SESBI_49702 [Sesbania bispinosa]